MIHVLLVDEQRLFSEAVRSLLATEDDIETIGIVTSGKDAISYIEEKQPDVILLDIHLPEVDGIKTVIHIKDKYPSTKVIFLTSFAENDLVISGMIAGADGFLLKDIDASNLIQSIRNAYNGQVVISGYAARILAKTIVDFKYERSDILKKEMSNRNIELTKRESDIALLMSDNLSNKEIAEKFDLTQGTIKNYISDLYSKIGVRTRREAVASIQDLLDRYYKK